MLDFFEARFKQAVLDIRDRLAAANIPQCEVIMRADGRSHSELKITFQVGGSWDDNKSTSHSLEAALAEYMRRHGWQEKNAPILIGGSCEPAPIPYEEPMS